MMQKLGYIMNLTKVKIDLRDLQRKKLLEEMNKKRMEAVTSTN